MDCRNSFALCPTLSPLVSAPIAHPGDGGQQNMSHSEKSPSLYALSHISIFQVIFISLQVF